MRSGISNFVFRVLVFQRSGVPAFRHSSVLCFSRSRYVMIYFPNAQQGKFRLHTSSALLAHFTFSFPCFTWSEDHYSESPQSVNSLQHNSCQSFNRKVSTHFCIDLYSHDQFNCLILAHRKACNVSKDRSLTHTAMAWSDQGCFKGRF